ncbi:hypothetical protein [Falsirhodobacter halotolerans]|uniref:hypothetical protein n=1 Tax=Falsirhodobacter halotolerans TaxID=1146892 RepID=UPI001FD1769F|nr:hypothetical protein [Falsirhodobacter halotolerans]MCJ8138735.1 hypothetical protein [Falsirhodobacter halotolerans]
MTTLTANTPVAASPASLGLWAKLVTAASIFGASVRVSAAIRSHRTPDVADLDVLGINPADMPKVY